MKDYCRKHSNIQAFLTYTTPWVPTYPLQKTCMRELNSLWQPVGKEKLEYFTFGDLWDRYSEWSVYGAGVPITLGNSESAVQYFVPYLSAIQIYTTKYHAASRFVLEESESESFSDDSESEKLSKSWDTVSDDSVFDQDASCSTKESLGQLYFQYIEYGSPYGRIPLVDKVNELAQYYPGLTSFKSVEVSPASWMSVAWYPIYHIPTRRNEKELSACFLTYHTISASFQDDDVNVVKYLCCDSADRKKRKEKAGCTYTALSSFGLASYKMQGNLWRNPESSDIETLSTMYNAAYSWLKQLKVEHHDFNFFTTH